jgi:predicted transcriptional regulator
VTASGSAGSAAGRPYRGYRVYAYIALARLFHALDLDISQPDLLERAPARIPAATERISKEEILLAIRSNSHMTEKVLQYLVAEGLATLARDERGYDIRITPAGVAHLRKYYTFYRDLYQRELDGHYRYTGRPNWLP